MARRTQIEAAEVSAAEAMRAISVIMRADIRRLFDRKGRLLPVQQWPDDMADIKCTLK